MKIAFTEVGKMYDFLSYQLQNSFHNNKEKYSTFIDDSILTHQHLIDIGKIEKVKRYINDVLLTGGEIYNDEDYLHKLKIPEGLHFQTPIKEYTQKELRGLYDMNEKLFRSFMNDYIQEIGKLGKSRKYTIKQVYSIFHLLGDPALKKKK